MRRIRYGWLLAWKVVRYACGRICGPTLWFIVTGQVIKGPQFIGRFPHVRSEGVIKTGRRLRMRSVSRRTSLSTGRKGRLTLGDDVSINQGSTIHADYEIKIGSRVSIGDCVRIYDTNFHAVSVNGSIKTRAVTIEDDVWLAANVTILPGVRIGRGAVIGTGTVVSADVPRGAVVVSAEQRCIKIQHIPEDFRRRGPLNTWDQAVER